MAKKHPNSRNRRNNNSKKTATARLPVEDYRHEGQKRKNIPPAKIAAEGTIPLIPKIQYAYSPRRPPVLRFDESGRADRFPELIAEARHRPLSEDEARLLAGALRVHEPWLEWAGKREAQQRRGFTVDPVALHIHERVSAEAILRVAARQDIERTLFGDPQLAYHEAVQFYRHNIDWTNRLILGDSLQVMASLAHREDLAGKVQMMYMDPPYGIKFASNFQSEVGQRDVKEREQDLTREAETVKAYRDTWSLGAHSYLGYLRDRFTVARELLADTGSAFVQIGEDNVHRVREVLDGVFGAENFVITLLLKKKGGQKSGTIDPINDYILWTTKDKAQAATKFRPLFRVQEVDAEYLELFGLVELPNGSLMTLRQLESNRKTDYRSRPDRLFTDLPGSRLLTSGDATIGGVRKNQSLIFRFQGRDLDPGLAKGTCWKHTAVQTVPGERCGMERLAAAERLYIAERQVRIKRYADDFGAMAVSNWWDEFGGAMDRVYAVQTNPRVVERCMLMCTDPGDLVLDPTCGSGTSAFVAEQWGRRWVTIDTSRVAIAIARQRLLTAKYDFYRLRAVSPEDSRKNPAGAWLKDPLKQIEGPCTFKSKRLPHVTSSVVANCYALDPIVGKHELVLDEHLRTANAALAKVASVVRQTLASKLLEKQKRDGKRAITDADRRRWELPKTGDRWEHWEVPFDIDPDWPKPLQDAVTAYRKAWRAKMDEVNACIAANAEPEELVDQPEVVPSILRVSGPFTVEAVQPPEESLGHVEEREEEGFEGAPEEIGDTFGLSDVDRAVQNVEAYIVQMMRLLRTDGVRFPDNRQMRFSRLEPVTGSAPGIHAEGRWAREGEKDTDPEGRTDVAVGFGPQYGPVTAPQVEELIRSANRRGYDHLVIAGFSFDGPAQAVIEEDAHPKLRIHMAHVRPDVNPGMAGLLKEQPGSQLFTVFGRPRTKPTKQKDGDWVVTLEGVDIYDPVTNTITGSGASKVAAWFLDGDYDGRTFCITQAFFPNRDVWDKLAKALSASEVIDASVFEALSGTVSLPFPPGKNKRVAVKVIDPRGNEVMQIHRLE